MNRQIVPIIILVSIDLLASVSPLVQAQGMIVVDGSLSDWSDLGISPIGIDSDDQWAGYADLLKFWACMDNENLYLAIQVDWEYPVDYGLAIFSVLITPENSSSWYEAIWGNYSYAILLGHGEASGEVQNVTSATGWDGVIEFSILLSSMDNPEVVTLEVDSYSSDWIYNIDMMPAPWEEPYKIREFPSLLILPIFMITALFVAIIYRRKHPVRLYL